jgi:uncharacterized protein
MATHYVVPVFASKARHQRRAPDTGVIHREVLAMQAEEQVLLRIFLGEDDRQHSRPLYRVLVERAFEEGMAGATVLHGPFSFGPSGHARSELNIDAGPRDPMIVEILDREAKIRTFLEGVEALIRTGLVTMEKVQVRRYRRPAPQSTEAGMKGHPGGDYGGSA